MKHSEIRKFIREEIENYYRTGFRNELEPEDEFDGLDLEDGGPEYDSAGFDDRGFDHFQPKKIHNQRF